MNLLQGYESDEDKSEKLAIDNDNNDNDNDNNDNDNDDRTRIERATRKRIKLRNDTAELPDDFFIATPGTNDNSTDTDTNRPTKQPLPAVIRPLIPPQLARRRANKSTEDDAVRYGVSTVKK